MWKPPRRLGQRIGGIEVGAVRAGEALSAFHHIGARREAALRQSCGEQAVIRRLAGMQRLAHGAEHRLEPRRLGSRDAEGGGEFLRIQAQQMRARRRGAEAAEGAGGVEAERVVVARCEQQAEPALQFIAGDERGQHVLPELPRSSASASNADSSTTDGWPVIARLTSSKSSACDAAPFTSAADSTGSRVGMADHRGDRRTALLRASANRMSVSSSFAPASVHAT